MSKALKLYSGSVRFCGREEENMPLRFWIYLMIKVITIVLITALALLILPASSNWIFPFFSRFWLIFDVLLVCMLLLDRVIEWKIKKVDSEAGAEANKAMLKRYKVIDWITLGFYFFCLVCVVIRWVHSWFP